MTKEEQQAKIAELKKAPKLVQHAVLIALLLGLVTMIRMPIGAYAGHLSVGRAVLYGLLMFAVFFFNGASLYTRNRWGYIAVIVFALLPLLGLLAWSLHLVLLTLQGKLSESWPVAIHCMVCVVQLIVTVILFCFLLIGEVRNYVWSAKANPPPIPGTNCER